MLCNYNNKKELNLIYVIYAPRNINFVLTVYIQKKIL